MKSLNFLICFMEYYFIKPGISPKASTNGGRWISRSERRREFKKIAPLTLITTITYFINLSL